MIKPLRKRHLVIWYGLALLLPAGMLTALLARPAGVNGQLQRLSTEENLPVVIREVIKNDYEVRLRGMSPDRPEQLEWANTGVLRCPTAVIYRTVPGRLSITDARLIGRIEARGTYHFKLPADSIAGYYFIVYDFIRDQRIDTIDLSLSQNQRKP